MTRSSSVAKVCINLADKTENPTSVVQCSDQDVVRRLVAFHFRSLDEFAAVADVRLDEIPTLVWLGILPIGAGGTDQPLSLAHVQTLIDYLSNPTRATDVEFFLGRLPNPKFDAISYKMLCSCFVLHGGEGDSEGTNK